LYIALTFRADGQWRRSRVGERRDVGHKNASEDEEAVPLVPLREGPGTERPERGAKAPLSKGSTVPSLMASKMRWFNDLKQNRSTVPRKSFQGTVVRNVFGTTVPQIVPPSFPDCVMPPL
jgi:hypothetical protein